MSDCDFNVGDLFGPPLRETCYGPMTQQQYEARRADEVLKEAVRTACVRCDNQGYRPNGLVCDHVDRTETVRRGSEQVRRVLIERSKPKMS